MLARPIESTGLSQWGRVAALQRRQIMKTDLNPPKPGTKEASLVAAITGRGKTVNQLSALMSWKPHTVRAAFTRLRSRGYVIDRIPKSETSPAKFRVRGMT